MSHILVIEDDQTLLEVYQLLLEPEGYTMTLSTRAYEHVTDVAALHPDLIILDLKLARGQHGLLFLQQLKGYLPTAAIPVLVCTAAEQLIQEHEAPLRAQTISILPKPFDMNELLQLIQQVLPSPGERAIERRAPKQLVGLPWPPAAEGKPNNSALTP